jgi:hypothetical protein
MTRDEARVLPVAELDELPDTHSQCRHCRYVLAELKECVPITPSPREWGAIPSWGTRSTVDHDHPAMQCGDCPCRCHAAWRMLTGNKL